MAGAETARAGLFGVGCELFGAGALHMFPEQKWMGVVLMAVGVVFLLQAAFTMLPVKVQAGIRARANRVEQSHFLLVALIAGVVMVAALGGAWWKSRGSPEVAANHETVSLQAQPVTFARSVEQAAPNPQIEIAGGPYLKDEVRTMILALNSLNDIVNRRGEAVVAAGLSISNNWWRQFKDQGEQDYLKRLNDLMVMSGNVANDISKAVSDNNNFQKEIEPPVRDDRAATGELQRAAADFIDNIGAVASLDDVQKARILNKDASRLDQATRLYDAWIGQAAQRIGIKIQRLRDYKGQ